MVMNIVSRLKGGEGASWDLDNEKYDGLPMVREGEIITACSAASEMTVVV